jgi:hypothetical protein
LLTFHRRAFRLGIMWDHCRSRLSADSTPTQAGVAWRGFARGQRAGSKPGEPMARNFGMHQQIRPEYRGSLWPVLLIVFIVVLSGAIDIAAHHW